MHLEWPGVPGQSYRLETSSNLSDWNVLSPNVLATNQNLSISNGTGKPREFFRVRRWP
jgi:hypothetical protein